MRLFLFPLVFVLMGSPGIAQQSVDPRSFGASGDCTRDDTEAYRKAISAARQQRSVIGGQGCFKINGTLDNGGVTIRAPFTSYSRVTPSPRDWGHVLAHANPAGPLFQPSTSGWAIEGVVMFDPLQTGSGVSPVTRPPMINIETHSVDWSISRSVVVNAFDFVRTGPTSIIGDVRLVDNRIYAVRRVYDLHGRIPEVVFERGNIYSPGVFQSAAVFSNAGMLAAWTAKNGAVRHIDVGDGAVDGWAASSNFQFGYARAIDVTSGLFNLSVMSGERYDQVAQILRTSGSGGVDIEFSGGYGYMFSRDDRSASLAAFEIAGSGVQNVSITGFRGAYAAGSWCEIRTDSAVSLTIAGGTLDDFGRATGARNVPACRVNGALAEVSFRPGHVRGWGPGSVGIKVEKALHVVSDTIFDNIFLPISVSSSVASTARVVDRGATIRTVGPKSYASAANPAVFVAAGNYDKP